MYITAQQQEFSRAHVQAVAAAAGYGTGMPSVDDDSVDLAIFARGGGGVRRSPRLELQLKSERGMPHGDPIRYTLKQKNYDDLRHTDYQVPRILVVVYLPEDLAAWTAHADDALSLRYCAYWVTLYGLSESGNETKTVVSLPRANRFSVHGLTEMMQRIAQGALP
jgi:hypothetical protein